MVSLKGATNGELVRELIARWETDTVTMEKVLNVMGFTLTPIEV